MKLFTSVVLVLIMIFAISGAASADQPSEGTFQITGYTTSYEYKTLPNGLTFYHLLAQSAPSGAGQDVCEPVYGTPCGVTGYLDGHFAMEEWGQVTVDPATGQGSGKNRGIVTITGSKGQTVIQFNGDTDLQTVMGRFEVRQGPGHGEYTGDGGFVFRVTYTGAFN